MASLLPSAALIAAALIAAFSLLSPVADARPGAHFHPCNTLFISYTISTTPSSADSALAQISAADPKTFGSFAVFRIVRPLRPYYYSTASASFPDRRPIHRPALADPIGVSSLQERAKDILFVVVGLLFGVGCGALTAATIYLAWSLVTNRYEAFGGADGGFSDTEEDANPKKLGYVKIADPAAPVAPVKEGYEG